MGPTTAAASGPPPGRARAAGPLAAVTTIATLVAACGGQGGEASAAAAVSPTRQRPAPIERAPLDAAELGAVAGRVRVEGALPARAPATAALPAGCEHGDDAVEPAARSVHGVDGGLGGAYVAVVGGHERWAFPPDAAAAGGKPARIEQRGCLFVPRLVAVRAGEVVLVGNADPVTHNVHTRPRRAAGRNVTQVAGGADLELGFERGEIVPIVCDLHPWMRAFVAVAEHPLFDVTEPDGSFRLEGVPPGTYAVEVWHEVLGELRAEVTVAPRQEARLDFRYPSDP